MGVLGTPVMLALRMLRQENRELQAVLGYIVRPCLQEEKKKIRKEKSDFL
jgi:hypothetical protein